MWKLFKAVCKIPAILFIALMVIYHFLEVPNKVITPTTILVPMEPNKRLNSIKVFKHHRVVSRQRPLKCESPEILEERSKIWKAKIAENCIKYHHEKRVDWKRFGNGTNNGYVKMDHLNPPEIWWSNFVVSEKLQAILTVIEKSGSSTSRKALSMISTEKMVKQPNLAILKEKGDNGDYGGSLYMFGNIGSGEKARHVYDTYFKFVFVRDPLQRLYSAFNDKLFQPKSHIKMLDPYKESMNAKNETPTFLHFLDFLDTLNDSSKFDQHFRPQEVIANPCEISYDYIAHTDDISCSIQYLFKKLNPSIRKIPMPYRNSTKEWEAIIGDFPEMVRNILRKHYQVDYDIFGFELPPILKTII